MCPQNGLKHKAAITVRNQCLLLFAFVLFRVKGTLTNMAQKK